MKNTLLTIAAISLTACSALAQDSRPVMAVDSRDQFMFGLKVGANYSNVYDTKGDNFNADGKFGVAAGGFISIPIVTLFGIQPEILFSQKGFKGTGNILGGSYELTRTSNYLDVPIFLAFKPDPVITILAGPQYSYLLSQKDAFTNGSITTAQKTEFENDNIRKNTLCFVGGLDLNLTHAVIGARAGWDIQNNNGDGSSTTPRYKNVWYQLTIGFRL